ncbi:aspartyl-phosphate phosphatase Spo0E family protein [Bacillus sp. 31A1R]|uniref:Aspartyl-phosphate phosphatase Spo0E family protein n=1 Tax=Robertmurraya mangrovi TaxID=3098077 RepID=A0ABU5J433_9BACI|nr:aspartyl-phosphate phosphatase Spo0E family protein [Bacillus sp. 31A1R]MDZ5474159.1 aspartyl-phosphate phosphatase Spo0E family protein [Bacillus sp. 31A1R]
MCVQDLLEDIESCRREMVHLASHSSLSNQKVVEISTKLDQLLNKYYSLTVNEKQ